MITANLCGQSGDDFSGRQLCFEDRSFRIRAGRYGCLRSDLLNRGIGILELAERGESLERADAIGGMFGRVEACFEVDECVVRSYVGPDAHVADVELAKAGISRRRAFGTRKCGVN